MPTHEIHVVENHPKADDPSSWTVVIYRGEHWLSSEFFVRSFYLPEGAAGKDLAVQYAHQLSDATGIVKVRIKHKPKEAPAP